ncbi:hypothetical protein F5Y10DRAFT_289237 [Nemania abortiva]|nr:hypothetical protein F5Y10DRAFT_289237 [Nemania abortiva]
MAPPWLKTHGTLSFLLGSPSGSPSAHDFHFIAHADRRTHGVRLGSHDAHGSDRWRHSPPEEEPASLHAIRSAIQKPPGATAVSLPNPSLSIPQGIEDVFGTFSLHSGSDRSNGVFGSAVSSGSSNDSGSSAGSSAFTFGLHNDDADGLAIAPPPSRKRRRQWRQRPRATTTKGSANKENPRIYQCTFCTDTFTSRYDWTRHEGTLHLRLERWTCLPFGPRRIQAGESSARCSFCDVVDPSDAHMLTHNSSACTTKPIDARIFHRKDHFRQHLRLVHNVTELTTSIDAWKARVVKVKSRCGFCGETFTSWPDRNDHLTDHFRTGALMKDWKGCRGLEPALALLVENAIPPYLIGTEATDVDPFSALQPGSKAFRSTNATKSTPRNTFEELTARLGEYVQGAVSRGVLVTDDVLRREARVILYSDDDPWNQTPADNLQWLDMFKIGYGLSGPARAEAPSATGACFPTAVLQGVENGITSLRPGLTPFTLENMQHAAGGNSTYLSSICGGINLEMCAESVATPGVSIPWSWQTPECLAEFRQMGCIPTLATECSQANSNTFLPDGFDLNNTSEHGCLLQSTNFVAPDPCLEPGDASTEPATLTGSLGTSLFPFGPEQYPLFSDL